MSQQIPDAWFHRIKAATRDLVSACGGIVRSGELCDYSKTDVGRWQNPRDKAIIPLNAAMALESECGMHFVLTAYADLHGRRVSDPTANDGEAASVFMRHAEAVTAAAELMAAGAAAAADGKLTPTEAEMLDRAAGTVETATARLRMDLAAAKFSRLKVVGDSE